MAKRIAYLKPPHLANLPTASQAYERRDVRQADKNFYASKRWRQLRARKLKATPLCEECRRQGRLTPAVHVHHLQPRKARPDLAYDPANLEALCLPCHNAGEVR